MGTRGPLYDNLSGRSARLGRWRGGPPRLPESLRKATMPRDLSPVARKFWRTHAPDLERRGCLTKLDGLAFRSVCDCWAMIELLGEAVRRDGVTITGPRGKVTVNPLVRERARWERLFFTLARDFGLTPSSRRRLGAVEPDPVDDEFFGVLDGGRKDPEVDRD